MKSKKKAKKKGQRLEGDGSGDEGQENDLDIGQQPTEPTLISSPTTTPVLNASTAIASRPETVAENVPLKLLMTRQQQAKGHEEFHRGDYRAAIASYTKSIALAAANPPLLSCLLTHRAKAKWALKEYLKAIDDCMAAIQCDALYCKAYICRANSYLCVDKLNHALDDYSMAIRLTTDKNRKLNLEKVQQIVAERLQLLAATPKKGGKSTATQGPDLEWFRAYGLLELEEEESQGALGLSDAKPAPPTASGAITTPSDAPTTGQGIKREREKAPAVTDVLVSDDTPPLLIPVGEIATIGDNAIELPDIQKRIERGAKEKELGNQAYQDGNFLAALIYYSNAIKIQPQYGPNGEDMSREVVFYYSNRALVYIKLGRYYEAISDCTASIERRPTIKAYARRAAGWAALSKYAFAAEDYKRALKFENRNQDCLSELHKCLIQIEEECNKELAENPNKESARRLLRRAKEDYKRYIEPLLQTTTQASGAPLPKSKGVQERELLDEIIDLTKRLTEDPNDSTCYLARARAYIKRGEIDKAATDCRLGLHKDPDNQELQQTLKYIAGIKRDPVAAAPAAKKPAPAAAAGPAPATGAVSSL
jgi:tetratricopeptide (TPR) repeat protein